MAKINFDDVVDRFFGGVRLEAEASDIEMPEAQHLGDYLRYVYLKRHERQDPDPIILDCAQILGQITFAMYRAELPEDVGNPHIPHTPIEVPNEPPTRLEIRHVNLARETYGSYVNSKVIYGMKNPLLAPIPDDSRGKEVDKPCPLCP